MKNIFALLALLCFSVSSLFAGSFYIKVAALSHSDQLFSLKYQLEEMGLKTYITEDDGLFRVYTGPFRDKQDAQRNLAYVQRKVSRDAYVTALEVMDERVAVSAVTKEPLPEVVQTQPVQQTQQVQTQTQPNAAVQESIQTPQNSSSSTYKRSSNFYVGASMGATKYDVSKSGTLPLSLALRTYGPSYGIEGGYYFYDNLFASLNYQRSELRYEDFDAMFATINYQFDGIGTLSPYVGVLAGVSKLSWGSNPVSGAASSTDEDSMLYGVQFGGDLHIYKGAYAFAYYRYMQLDFTTRSTLGTAFSEVDHSSQQDFNVGLKYKF